jgi:putative two-component system response regulator
LAKPADAYRVLVVEDEVDLGHRLCRYLETRGLQVVFASSLEKALAILRQGPRIDLAITDIYLAEDEPAAGGHRIAAACRGLVPPVPVILLTGRPSLDAALEGLREHACDLLTKPLSLAQVHQRAIKAIEEGRLRRRLTELEEVNRLLSSILPNAIEAKDPLTRGHSDRVADYAAGLGLRCRLAPEESHDLRLAAMLHDVGKIGVPEAILTKPGPLTAAERREMQKHPEIGHRILEPLQHLPCVRDWVFQHHERWDGRGYPRGLAKEEVELPGRILILAEVFDALATARSYKEAWPKEKVADYFEEEAGGQFDPELARIVAEGIRRHGTRFFRAGTPGKGREEAAAVQLPLF